MSEQLASFVTDFESKILRPVREKRAAGDEILAIQPVALGVSTAVQQGLQRLSVAGDEGVALRAKCQVPSAMLL